MLPIEFMSAQYGAKIKAAGAYVDQKIEGIVPNGSAGLVITVLKNQDGTDVLAKYCGANTIFPPNFIRVDNVTDFYFKEVTISQSAGFILNK